MRVLREEDFKKLAQEVVDAYLKQAMPLADSAVKVAMDNGLNPDQIKQLVQLANTMAHLSLFDQKSDGDKCVEFEPADPDNVLKKIYVDGEPVEESSSSASPSDTTDMFSDFKDIMDKVRSVVDEARSAKPPEAIEGMPPEAEAPSAESTSPAKQQMIIIKIRKVAADLTDKQHQAGFEYKEELDKLATEFAKLYGPDFEEFEKDAYALRGDSALPVLADLRHCLKLAAAPRGAFVKQARVVDANTKEMRSLIKLADLAHNWQEYGEALKHLQEQAGDIL